MKHGYLLRQELTVFILRLKPLKSFFVCGHGLNCSKLLTSGDGHPAPSNTRQRQRQRQQRQQQQQQQQQQQLLRQPLTTLISTTAG